MVLEAGRDAEGVTHMVEYRQRNDSDTWHWCQNCTNWPTAGYSSRHSKPTSGELCDQCLSKEDAGNCDT